MTKAVAPGGIKSWPQNERPRERLIQNGVKSLSDAELLAILLRSGIRGKDAIALSRELLNQFGGLRGLLSVEYNKLAKVKGLGQAKIATLLSTTEIVRRKLKEDLVGKNFIRDPESVVQYLYTSLRDKKKEIFKVLFLNKANRIIGEQDLFEGTIDETAIHTREVVKTALDCHASSLILVHNHPSGRTEPSSEDKEITQKIQMACASVSIRVLDHLIVGDNQYFSFQEHGLL